MKFVLLFGPQAVGKMTVGRELAKITDLKLFHNHMSIDLLVPLFDFTPEMWRLCHMFRKEVFNTFAESNQYGIIFTTVWAFDQAKDWENVEEICRIFRAVGADIYFVELEAGVEERLKRNVSSNRLEQKPIKRNLEQSENHLLSSMEEHRLYSLEEEIKEKNYIRIDNTNLTAEEVAQMIKGEFRL